MTLTIEHDIPIPEKRHGGSREGSAVWQLRRMRVGDSVLVPRPQNWACAIGAHSFGPGRFTTRREAGGTRIWRTA